MIVVPEPPNVAENDRAVAPMTLRYEDVAQDGRVMLEALPHGMGESIWRKVLRRHPVSEAARERGIVPILTRIVSEGFDDPISVFRPLEGHGCFQLAHTIGTDGAVDRILLNLWLDVRGVLGRTHGSVPREGEPIRVGRVFAEHVFTKPFAPRGERKILKLDFEGFPAVPAARYSWREPAALLELPKEAMPLDEDLVADAAPVAFGLGHTDSNQHVNSLVYPRIFEEAVVRRLLALGKSTALLPRALDVAYRKPCFAGDRARLRLRTFALGNGFGAVGVYESDDASARPHCYLRMRFAP